MGRRRITVADDAEILVHWRAGRGIREIARSLGYARNTVRERIATAIAAGFRTEGPSLSAAEWRAALAAASAERGDQGRRFPAQRKIERLGEQVRVVASDERSQARNRALALERLGDRLAAALVVAPSRRPTRPTLGAKRRRLDAKSRRSETKRLRRPPPD